MAATVKKVLFVCAGNTCRSVMAQYFARAKAPAGVSFFSAGLTALPGSPASEHAAAVLAAQGVKPEGHKSALISAELAAGSDLILAMTAGQKARIEKLYPQAVGKTHTLKGYSGLGEGDIEDPYGGGADAYHAAFVVIRECVLAVLEKLKKEVK